MPEYQDKFCTVRRGEEFHTISVPNPKKYMNVQQKELKLKF
jgi:hypothetical protein